MLVLHQFVCYLHGASDLGWKSRLKWGVVFPQWLQSLQPNQQIRACGPQTFVPSGRAFGHIGELDPNSKSIEKPFPPTFQKKSITCYGDLTQF